MQPISRLIPAHAGKTSSTKWTAVREKAHPRSRGENGFFSGEARCVGGSSPLTRGKLHGRHPVRVRQRLIPAHAGKTMEPFWYMMFFGGSSPLTRGKLVEDEVVSTVERLIPAHAGKTWGKTLQALPFQAHPRSRGENPQKKPQITAQPGSSPLTRGKRP